MRRLNKIYHKLIIENTRLTSPNGKKITDAIKNRKPISFYYNGPRSEVKAGRRIRVEPVALGLSKGGNVVVRGWVQPPSESKRGFLKHGWRLFRLDRLSNLIVADDEQFNMKHEKYKEGDDDSMTVTYVTTSWGSAPPEVKQVEPVQAQNIDAPETPEVPQTPPPATEPETQEPESGAEELPQPKPDTKPSIIPGTPKRDIEVFSDLEKQTSDLEGKRIVDPDTVKKSMRDLYLKKVEDWKNNQRSLNMNTIPGEGTRRKFEKDSEIEIYKLLKDKNINIQAKTSLQESIEKIKTLMFL